MLAFAAFGAAAVFGQFIAALQFGDFLFKIHGPRL
jgi:hypothetical protein